MENKTERSVNLIALLLVVAFTVLSCFTCFEFYSTTWKMPIVDDVRESITTLVDTKTLNIPVVLALGVLQVVLLCIRQRITMCLSMWCSVLGVLATGYELVQNTVYVWLHSNGGLGYMDCIITPVGYIVIALSVVNMLVQIISLKKKKEGNEP